MRSALRLLVAAAVAALPIGIALMSCGTDAQNIQACREIESARCDLAPACGATFDVAACKRYYRDACLLGTAQPDAGDTARIQPCIDALAACGAADASAAMGCPGQALHAGAVCQRLEPVAADGGLLPSAIDATPCNIIMYCPEVLEACAWVSPPDAGGADTGTDADGGGTGGGGTGGAGGKSGTGGSGGG